ncbi:MAG: hypothetical protein J6K88_06600 [Oscillospiraceae bacterium]|nr:hypothetical protein [Oscillospiraceae bacterium]
MKKQVSLLIALIMICTAVISAIPLSAVADSAGKMTWTLYDEAEKALPIGAEGKTDFSSSVFSFENSGSGSLAPVDWGVNDAGVLTLGNEKRLNNTAKDWKSTITIKENGMTVNSVSKYDAVKVVFTAPTNGTYALIPVSTDKSGQSAYATGYSNHIRVYTDSATLFSTTVLTAPDAKGYTEYFTQNGETWLNLAKGEKLYVEINPNKASNVASNPSNPSGGYLATLNFIVSLEATAGNEVIVNKSYSIKDEINGFIPKTGYEITLNGTNSTVGETATSVKNDTYYKYQFNNDAVSTAPTNARYSMEYYAPVWGSKAWGNAPIFKTNATLDSFHYADSNYNVTWYDANINKNTGLVTTKTNGVNLRWRVAFTAPEGGDYFIDLSAVTANDKANQRAKFKIYTSSNTDETTFDLISEDKAVYIGDFYAERTNVLYPCEDGLIPVTLKAGEKLYFESQFYKGSSEYTGGMTLTYNLTMHKGSATKNIPNDKLTLNTTVAQNKAVGNTFTLTATGVSGATSGTDIKWRSTNPAVATVDGTVDNNGNIIGNVKIVGNGTCDIIAYNEYTEVKCRVSTSAIATPSSVSITNGSAITMNPYDIIKLSISPSAENFVNVKWSSSDPDVIDVLSDGTLVFRDFGKKEVTITVNADSKTATCKVTPSSHTHTPSGVYKQAKAPNCTEEGIEVMTCTECNKAVASRAIPAKGHTYYTDDLGNRKGVVTVYPTVGVGGVMTYTCKICGAEDNDRIAAGILDTVVLTKAPTKLYFEVGETLDTTGLVVSLTYKNNSYVTDITDFKGIAFTYDFSKEAENVPVKFKYQGTELTFYVTVQNNDNPYIGDADGDGDIDGDDLVLLMKAVAGASDPIKFFNADINGDKTLDVIDAQLLKQCIDGYKNTEYFK